MKLFIDQVLDALENKEVAPYKATYVVPSRRVAVFLKKAIAQRLDQPVFEPLIYSVEDFVAQLAGVTIAPDVDLLFDFYDAYCTVEPKETRESLDEFLSWAPTILKDFNEIDRFLVPESTFFNYLGNLKELENNAHWSLDENSTPMVRNYLSFWDKLERYYNAFKQLCMNNDRVYQGLAYRIAFAKAESQTTVYSKDKPLVFMGLNALNKAEESIIQTFLEAGNTHVFWDADAHYMNDTVHEAGKFLRRYQSEWKYYENHPFEAIKNQFSSKKDIKVLGVTGHLGMAQVAGQQLEQLLNANDDLTNTAIILADEELLIPVLSAIPETVQHLNITMGSGIDKTPLASFFNAVIKLHLEHTDAGYYYKNIITILESSFTHQIAGNEAQLLMAQIRKNNLVYINNEHLKLLKKDGLLNAILQRITTVSELQTLLQSVVELLKLSFIASSSQRLELEQLLGIHATINQIETVLSQQDDIKELKTYHYIFKQLLSHKKLDFIGEPVQGLQIMGLLETRALDYDRYIMISVNEGVLPAGKSTASVIPYDMKMKFGLPTYSDKDSVYAYHFYRLLHRVNDATFIYNTEPSKLGSNERSRFIMQLEADRSTDFTVTHHTYGLSLEKATETLYEIQKSDSYFERLDEIRTSGFSPSSLTSYIYNPLDFYKRKILKVQDVDEVEEDIASNTMGTIIHKALEELYKDCIDQILNVDMIKKMRSRVQQEVENAYIATYGATDHIKGKNKIIYEVARHYVSKMLDLDERELKDGNEIVILELEAKYSASLEIEGIGTARLHGEVDRIDSHNNAVRIIDYKTGKVNAGQLKVNAGDEPLLITDYKKSKAFQVLQYAYMYTKTHGSQDVLAGIISFKNLNGGFLGYQFTDSDKRKREWVTAEDLAIFEEQLIALIKELYQPELPILEKQV